MESTYSRTPGWVMALIVILGVATLSLFLFLLASHARLRAMTEEKRGIEASQPGLRALLQQLPEQIKNTEATIADRKHEKQQYLDDDKTADNDVASMLALLQTTLKATEEGRAKRSQAYEELLKEMTTRRKELDTEEDHFYGNVKDQETRRQQKRAAIEALSQEIEGQSKKHRDANKELDTRIAELKTRVQQLTNQRENANRRLVPKGSVISSAAAVGFVVIDRGHKHRLRNGTRFAVYLKRAGQPVVKGAIEVIEVGDQTSVARVAAEYDLNDPIIAGDLLHNPVYDPDKVYGFAIRGDFQRFSTEELQRLILDVGGRIETDLSVNTDYLVAGTNCQNDLSLATKLGLSILSEDQVLDLVHLRPRFASLQGWEFVVASARAHKRFAVVGTFTKADRGSVVNLISGLGGKVDSSLGKDTDIVVAGSKALETMQQARSRNLPIIDQSQFEHLTSADVKAISNANAK